MPTSMISPASCGCSGLIGLLGGPPLNAGSPLCSSWKPCPGGGALPYLAPGGGGLFYPGGMGGLLSFGGGPLYA